MKTSGLKLAIHLEVPKEPEYKPSLMEKVEDCMAKVEYGTDREAYNYLRRVNEHCVKCYKSGKKNEKITKLLGILTPFMAKHGLQDPRGINLIEQFLTNPEYECEEESREDNSMG